MRSKRRAVNALERLSVTLDRLEGKPPPIDWKLLGENGTLFRVAEPGKGQKMEHIHRINARCPDCNSRDCCYECATRGGPGADLLLTDQEKEERRP